MFKAEVKLDEHLPNKAWLRVTHNGSNWSSIALNSQEEVQATIEALQSFSGLTKRGADRSKAARKSKVTGGGSR